MLGKRTGAVCGDNQNTAWYLSWTDATAVG